MNPLPVLPTGSTWFPPLRSPRTLGLLGLAALCLCLVDQRLGPMLALCLLPRAFQPAGEERYTPLRDLLLALACGLFLALIADQVWVSGGLTEGTATASDIAEHFWLLHTVENPGWKEWSINRYPLPTVLSYLAGFAGNPHDTWLRAAFVAMVGIGAGLYLWGRAVGGVGTGLAAVVMAGAFPDLVLVVRTVTAYPMILALWTLAAGSSAYAARFPGPVTCLLAGLGVAAVFASDARGLIPGLVTLATALVASFSAGSTLAGTPRLRRVLLCLAVTLAPVGLSYAAHNHLPLRLRSLEEMLEASVEASYSRVGQHPPPRHHFTEGYRWGQVYLSSLPATLLAMKDATGRLNQEVRRSRTQLEPIQRRVWPLLNPVIALSIAAIFAVGGLPPRARNPGVWFTWWDWRGKIGLMPVLAGLALLVNVILYEYTERYAALAGPSMALLSAAGITALGGRRAPGWCFVLVAAGLLYAVPGPLNLNASWRRPVASPRELVECLQAANGAKTAQLPPPTENCVRAQTAPLKGNLASPY